jgi:hypothetical protein
MEIYLRLIICFIIIIHPVNLISQSKLIPSLELGFSFSQFPSKSLYVTWQISDSTETRTNPIVSPVIGISSKLHLFNNFKVIIGLNYQLSGTKSYSYSHWTDPNIYPSSYFKYWQNLKIHKITMPVGLGFEFNFKQIKPMIFIETKPNFILSAKKFEKSYHSQWTEPIENKTNLFTKITDYEPPKRLINQISIGVAASIGKNTSINLNYSLGHNYYANTHWGGSHRQIPYYSKTSIPSSDFIISIQYNLRKP